jgi:spore germination cell wall hydrolase CwlJ-like protein
LYNEARGESVIAQEHVASVVVSRTESGLFPKRLCDVVYQKGQFQGITTLKIRDKIAFKRIHTLATKIIVGNYKLPNKGRLYFNQTRLGKKYKTKYEVLQVGNHYFY